MIALEIIIAVVEWIYTACSFCWAVITGKKYWTGT